MIKKFRRRIALALLPAVLITLKPTEARSNPAIIAPAACATGVGCIAVGIVFIGTVGYLVWQSQSTGKMYYDVIEEPEDHELWGIYRARDEQHCRWLAAGRPYEWRRGKCYIKG